jgi:hypothetical protein
VATLLPLELLARLLAGLLVPLLARLLQARRKLGLLPCAGDCARLAARQQTRPVLQ